MPADLNARLHQEVREIGRFASSPFVHGPGNRSIPASVVVPVLLYPDALAAADWLRQAVGFVERLRIGSHRIQLAVGTGAVVVAHGNPHPSAANSVMVRVANADEHFVRSTAHGAGAISPPTSHAYGERQYTVRDLAGHLWTFSQTEADVDPASWGGWLSRHADDAAGPGARARGRPATRRWPARARPVHAGGVRPQVHIAFTEETPA